jgi:putative membrane protein
MMDGWGWGGWVLGSLVMVAFWVVATWAFLTYVRAARPPPAGDAEEVLARRLAAGEIDETEYRRKLETLRSAR